MALKDHVQQRVRSEITDRAIYEVTAADGLVKLDAMESPYSWPIVVYPSASNFVLFKVTAGPASTVFELLLQQKVLAKNLDGQHHRLKDCLRVTVSTTAENDLFLEALSLAVYR